MPHEIDNLTLLAVLRRARARRDDDGLLSRIRGLVRDYFAGDDDGADYPRSNGGTTIEWPRTSEVWLNGELVTTISYSNDRLGDVVQPGIVHGGIGAGDDGERPAAGRFGNDVRDVADEQRGPSSAPGRAACPCDMLADWPVPAGPMDRQRAGTCLALAGRDRGPVEGSHAGPGR